MGRPRQLTPETQQRICKALRRGSTHVVAAGVAGVDRRTFYNWMSLGRSAESEQPYRDFYLAVREAERLCHEALLGSIADAAEAGDWRAAAWYAERKIKGFAKPQAVEVSGPKGGSVPVQLIEVVPPVEATPDGSAG